MSCGVGCRCGLDSSLLWPWSWLAATALIGSLAWEPPYAAGVALEKTKGQNLRILENHEQNVDGNVNSKDHSEASQMKMRNMLLEAEGKVILYIKWQRTQLIRAPVLVFCGK